MTRLSISELTTYRWTFDEDVTHYAANGIRSIGIWRHKLSDFGFEKGIELLSDYEMSVSSLFWAGGFTGSDGRTFKESLLDAREALRQTAALGARTLLVYTGARAGHTHNHSRRLFRNAVHELLPFAAEFGVTLAVEPMHAGCASEWTFLTEIDEAEQLVDEFASDYFKLAFDTYHLCQSEAILARLPQLTPKVAIVHLGDSRQPPSGEQNRCPLGEGRVPLAQTMSALASNGYRGYFEVELMGEEIELADYEDLLESSRQTFESLRAELEAGEA